MGDNLLLTVKHCAKVKGYYYLKKTVYLNQISTFKNIKKKIAMIAFDGKGGKGRRGKYLKPPNMAEKKGE